MVAVALENGNDASPDKHPARGTFAFPTGNACRLCGRTFRHARARRRHERRHEHRVRVEGS